MPHPPPQTAPAHPSSTANYSHHYPIPGQPSVPIVHTSDANTKLTDGIRRRCFNCCTTDTSTWRRSNLSPGKVVRLFKLVLRGINFRQISSSAINVVSLSALILVLVQNNFRTNVVLSLPLAFAVEPLQLVQVRALNSLLSQQPRLAALINTTTCPSPLLKVIIHPTCTNNSIHTRIHSLGYSGTETTPSTAAARPPGCLPSMGSSQVTGALTVLRSRRRLRILIDVRWTVRGSARVLLVVVAVADCPLMIVFHQMRRIHMHAHIHLRLHFPDLPRRMLITDNRNRTRHHQLGILKHEMLLFKCGRFNAKQKPRFLIFFYN